MSNELIEKLESNWELYVKLVGKIKNEDARTALLGLCDELKDRLAAAPASTQTKFIAAFPGGLVSHSLNVLRVAKNVNEACKTKIDSDSIIITSLFHDVGKVGNADSDYYTEHQSDWHKNRGIMYEINEELGNIPVSQRSLWWINGSGCPLSEDELAAIASLANVGQSTFASQFYNAPMLTVVLQTAVRVACIQGTGKTTVLG
jgi:hypothetical protein